MRKLKDCLRLKFDCGLSHAQIGRALGLSKGVVTKYLQRAHQVGLTWETAAGLDEAVIAARLSPAQVATGIPARAAGLGGRPSGTAPQGRDLAAVVGGVRRPPRRCADLSLYPVAPSPEAMQDPIHGTAGVKPHCIVFPSIPLQSSRALAWSSLSFAVADGAERIRIARGGCGFGGENPSAAKSVLRRSPALVVSVTRARASEHPLALTAARAFRASAPSAVQPFPLGFGLDLRADALDRGTGDA